MAAPGGADRVLEAVDQLLVLHAVESDQQGGSWCKHCVACPPDECEVADLRTARLAMKPEKLPWTPEVQVGYLGE